MSEHDRTIFERFFASSKRTSFLLPSLALVFVLAALARGAHDPWFFVVPGHETQGIDFYCVPKAFRNLLVGKSAFDTWSAPAYGPAATWFVLHPAVAIWVGGFFSFFPPKLAYGIFVCATIAMLAVSAEVLVAHVRGEFEKTLVRLAFLGSPLTYWLLYVGNVHGLVVLAVSLLFSGLLDRMRSEDAANERRIVLKVAFGLGLSLLSKPLLVLVVPGLLLVGSLRRAVLLTLCGYAALSLSFLVIPWLNPEGVGLRRELWLLLHPDYVRDHLNIYRTGFRLDADMRDNVMHWLHMIAQSGYEWDHVQLFSLPTLLRGVGVSSGFSKAAALLPLALSPLLLVDKTASRRAERLVSILIVALAAHFIGYAIAWEYQYTQLLPVFAVALALRPRDSLFRYRSWLFVAFGVLLAPLPVAWLAENGLDELDLVFLRSLRVAPAMVLFGVGVAASLVGRRRTSLPARVAGAIPFSASALLFAATAALTTWFFESKLRWGYQGTDDAQMFFRYARNFVEGHDFVFNPGGPRVEGFTSALWFFTSASAFLFGSGFRVAIYLFVWGVLGCVLAGLTSLGADLSPRERRVFGKTTFVAFAFFLGQPTFWLWNAASLMDAGLYAAVVGSAYWVGFAELDEKLRRRLALAVVVALLVVRPEGLGFAFLFCGVLGLRAKRFFGEKSGAAEKRTFYSGLGALVFGAALLFGVRYSLFGALFPNPLYAKVTSFSGERIAEGARYVLGALEAERTSLFLAALGTASLLLPEPAETGEPRRRRDWFVALGAWAFFAASLVVPLVSGGDVFGGHRFAQVAVAPLVVPLLRGVRRLASFVRGSASLGGRERRAREIALFGALAFAPLAALPGRYRLFLENNRGGSLTEPAEHVASEFWIARADTKHGVLLGKFFAPLAAEGSLPLIGYAAAGGIGVGYRGPIFDAMGLNDPWVRGRCEGKRGPLGHACFDEDRFYEVRPDVLLPRAAPLVAKVDLNVVAREFSDPKSWDFRIFRGIFASPRFRREYPLARIDRDEFGLSVHGFFREDFLARLETRGDYVVRRYESRLASPPYRDGRGPKKP